MAGRPLLIKSPEILWSLFEEYKEWAKNNPILIEDYVGKDADRVMRQKPRALTMEGFESFVAYNPDMPIGLQNYFANTGGAYEEFLTICSRIRTEIRSDQIEGGMAGIYNPSITQRLNGLTDKLEQTNVGDGIKVEIIRKK
ncbi:DNA-packaging protein [Parapedobacter lycopersici]|uniref:DNA-packaging protein n=1 Tax=Parapedobacter lycopersici TaxID=1864939 RepID=UPI00214D1A7C|nr:DNA-packaging protein [Parapedobacter lycopersici]